MCMSTVKWLICTFYSYTFHFRAHVPGAVFYDLFCNVPPSKLFPKPVPDEAAFVKYARSCGVNTSSHVVLYDNTGETYYRPSRGWWLFRVSRILLRLPQIFARSSKMSWFINQLYVTFKNAIGLPERNDNFEPGI